MTCAAVVVLDGFFFARATQQDNATGQTIRLEEFDDRQRESFRQSLGIETAVGKLFPMMPWRIIELVRVGGGL